MDEETAARLDAARDRLNRARVDLDLAREQMAAEIRRANEAGVSNAVIAKRFGVSRQRIFEFSRLGRKR